MSIQIFPLEHRVIARGADVTDAGVPGLLPVHWRQAVRVVIQEDGAAFVGVPAVRDEASAAQVLAALLAHPPVASVITARAVAAQAAEQQALAEIEAARKDAVYPSQIIAKGVGRLYWAPYMAGYESVVCLAGEGDQFYSRARDAEADGYDPAVGLPILRDAEATAARQSELFADSAKRACSLRIFAVTKDLKTQFNISTHVQDLIDRKADGQAITEAEQLDIDMARAIKTWVTAMREACRVMIASGGDPSADASWPPAPAGAVTFANRF